MNRYEMKVSLRDAICEVAVRTDGRAISEVSIRLDGEAGQYPEIEKVNTANFHFSSTEELGKLCALYRLTADQRDQNDVVMATAMILDWLKLYFLAPDAINVNELIFDEFVVKYSETGGDVPDIYFAPKHLVASCRDHFESVKTQKYLGKFELQPGMHEAYFLRPSIEYSKADEQSDPGRLFVKMAAARHGRISKWWAGKQ
jgi:hypothetical protein